MISVYLHCLSVAVWLADKHRQSCCYVISYSDVFTRYNDFMNDCPDGLLRKEVS